MIDPDDRAFPSAGFPNSHLLGVCNMDSSSREALVRALRGFLCAQWAFQSKGKFTTESGVAEFHVVSGVVKADDRRGAAVTVLVTVLVGGHGGREFHRIFRLRSPSARRVEE